VIGTIATIVARDLALVQPATIVIGVGGKESPTRKTKTTMSTEITVSQIKALRTEAERAGDHFQVVICDRALNRECDGSFDALSTGERHEALQYTQETALLACAGALAETTAS